MAYTTTVTQKITSTDDTEITTSSDFPNLSMMTLANIHDSSSVKVDLYLEYITNTTSTISDTGTNVNEGSGEAVSINTVTVTVDGTAATDDVFKNKKVYKSDATLFGTCTSVTNTTTIVFSNGLETAMVDDNDLYTPIKYYIMKNVEIPAGATLKLEGDEINFDQNAFAIYINCTVANIVDVVTRPS